MVKLRDYFETDGKTTVGVTYSWSPDDQIQMQRGPLPDQWLLVKGYGKPAPVEEFRIIDGVICRGHDTSMVGAEWYQLTKPPQPVDVWLPAEMNEGDWFLREPTVIFYSRISGQEVRRGTHRTWALLKKVHSEWTGLKGLKLRNVIEIHVFDGDAGKASGKPFEIYGFAPVLSMVWWEGEINGKWGVMKANAVFNGPILTPAPLPQGKQYQPMVAAPEPTTDTRTTSVRANVRKQPSTSADVLTMLEAGTTVRIVRTVQPSGDTYMWYERAEGGYLREDVLTGYSEFPAAPRSPDGFWLLNPARRFPHIVSDRFDVARNYPQNPHQLQKHEGWDFAPTNPAGSNPVVAAHDGVVSKVATNANGYGLYVRIDHAWQGKKYVTWYGHLERVAPGVAEGVTVTADQIIGEAGVSGNVTGEHVHLTLQAPDTPNNYVVSGAIDPAPYFVAKRPAPPVTEPVTPAPEPDTPPAFEVMFDTPEDKARVADIAIAIFQCIKEAPGRRVYIRVTTEPE